MVCTMCVFRYLVSVVAAILESWCLDLYYRTIQIIIFCLFVFQLIWTVTGLFAVGLFAVGLFAAEHFAVGHLTVRILTLTDASPHGYFVVRTLRREDTSP